MQNEAITNLRVLATPAESKRARGSRRETARNRVECAQLQQWWGHLALAIAQI
jgi:hypothetical protein